MRNLMITGGAGFIGSNFCRLLLEQHPDYHAVVYDKLTYAGNLDNLKDVAERFADSARVRARADNTLAEADYALGRRERAVRAFDGVVRREGAPPEDGARALDRLGECFASLGSLDAVARVSETLLRRFSTERHYARRAADRWVESASSTAGAPTRAALEQIVRVHTDLPTVAARAAVALAREQQQQVGAQVVGLSGMLRTLQVARIPGIAAAPRVDHDRSDSVVTSPGSGNQRRRSSSSLARRTGTPSAAVASRTARRAAPSTAPFASAPSVASPAVEPAAASAKMRRACSR